MHPFEYVVPASVDEALEHLGRWHGDAKVLAGGQSLIPLLNYRLARPRVVVDINRLVLDVIVPEDGVLRLGALTRHHTLEASDLVQRQCGLLREAAALIGNVRVRSRGTLGGSLAHADPAAELPLAMTVLAARFTLAGPHGRREVEAERFFTGYLSTSMESDELLIEVRIPATGGCGHAIEEFARRQGDFALVAATAVVSVDRHGRVDDARLAFGGVGPGPVRARRAEDVLHGQEPTLERIARASQRATLEIDPPSDPFATAAYRRHLAGVLARRALARAVTGAVEVA